MPAARRATTMKARTQGRPAACKVSVRRARLPRRKARARSWSNIVLEGGTRTKLIRAAVAAGIRAPPERTLGGGRPGRCFRTGGRIACLAGSSRERRMTRSGTLILGVLVSSLGAGSADVPRPAPPRAPAKPALPAAEPTGPGFRLSEGTEEAPAARTAVASSPLLDARDTQRVLDRLPPLTVEAGDAVEFALREKSLPPPRTGRTVKEAFPPPVTAPPPDPAEAGPLRVLRRCPAGAA